MRIYEGGLMSDTFIEDKHFFILKKEDGDAFEDEGVVAVKGFIENFN